MSGDGTDHCAYENVCVDLPSDTVTDRGKLLFIDSPWAHMDITDATPPATARKIARHKARLYPYGNTSATEESLWWIASHWDSGEMSRVDIAVRLLTY
jgi:hypothetical protein